MNILITRPSPYGNQLTNQLNAIGKKAWHLPLITFSPTKNLQYIKKYLNTLIEKDLVFIMSQTAIHYANSTLLTSQISWPKTIYYYTIGQSTASKISKYTGIKSIIYPKTQETSEELLKLPELNNKYINGKRALIIHGNKGRTILTKTLQERGVQVTHCKSYLHIPIQYNGEEQSQKMMQIGINAILITSKEILNHLYYLLPDHHKKYWLMTCTIIAISCRIAKHAKQLGWKKIIITKTIKNNELINILLQI